MPKDTKLFDEVAKMLEDLDISAYPRLLLTCMVYWKIKHPMDKTDEIARKVTKKLLPDLLKKEKKGSFIIISTRKEFELLEISLHQCENLPNGDGLHHGNIVANTVKYYAAMLVQKN